MEFQDGPDQWYIEHNGIIRLVKVQSMIDGRWNHSYHYRIDKLSGNGWSLIRYVFDYDEAFDVFANECNVAEELERSEHI